MDLQEKLRRALVGLEPEELRFRAWEDGALSGVLVSRRFRDMPALERQTLIDEALRRSPEKLSKKELGRVLLIAALTPAEAASVEPDEEDRGSALPADAKVIPWGDLRADPEGVLNRCFDSGEPVVVEIPDRGRVSIRPVDSGATRSVLRSPGTHEGGMASNE